MDDTMKQYLGTKILFAKPMKRGDYVGYRGWVMPTDEDPEEDGYLVEYTDGGKANHPAHAGYISWSPKPVFEQAYRLTNAMTFGHALEALKMGMKVTRQGWNGRGMYLWLMPEATVKAEWCREPHLKHIAEANGGEVQCLGSIRMFTVNRDGRRAVLTGWLASQSDMLAEDWMIVP